MTEIKIPSNQSAPDSSPDSTSILSKLPTYFKENPFLTLLNLGLIIGGLIAFTFFAKIEYLPDVDVNDVTTLLIGIALIGIVASLALSICLLLPSWLIQTLFSGLQEIDKDKAADLIDQKKLRKARSSNLLFSGTLIGAITFFEWIIALNLIIDFDWELLGWGIAALVLFVVIQISRYIWAISRFQLETTELIFGNKKKFVLFNLKLFFAWLFPCFLLIFISIDSIVTLTKENNWSGMIEGMGLLFLVVFSNSLLAALHVSNKEKPILIFQSYIYMASALLIAFLAMPGTISLVNTPFRILHLGDIQNSFFIVKEDTCNTFNTLIPASCIKNDKTGCIHPNSVASRIGSEYLLVFEGTQIPNKKTKDISIPLKKDDVLGWSFGSGAKMPQACTK